MNSPEIKNPRILDKCMVSHLKQMKRGYAVSSECTCLIAIRYQISSLSSLSSHGPIRRFRNLLLVAYSVELASKIIWENVGFSHILIFWFFNDHQLMQELEDSRGDRKRGWGLIGALNFEATLIRWKDFKREVQCNIESKHKVAIWLSDKYSDQCTMLEQIIALLAFEKHAYYWIIITISPFAASLMGI